MSDERGTTLTQNTEKMVVIDHLVEVCARCNRPFTPDEWDDRHWEGEGAEDVHAGCCQDCLNE
jgi:NMD protein affecting ribosome stability and mRNA decay